MPFSRKFLQHHFGDECAPGSFFRAFNVRESTRTREKVVRFASGLAQGVSRPETRPRPPVGDRARGTRRGLLPPPEGSHFSHLFLPFHTFFFIFPTSSYFFLPSPTFSLTFPDLLQPPPAFSDLNDFEGHSEYSECSSEQR